MTAALQHADGLILATDPDREGEAISWHVIQELKERGALPDAISPPQRITFTEVTKPAVLQALSTPRELSIPLVDAYMARRALDYLFGFHLSPLLWRKLPGARSAGRVQSVALRLVAEREAAIESFLPQKYWTVHADIAFPGNGSMDSSRESGNGMRIEASLVKMDGKGIPSPGLLEEAQASRAVDVLRRGTFAVSSVSVKDSSRHPPPPFTTSTLQQEANKKLGMSTTRTMQLAQKLYEGGYITYMRTDGTNLAPGAINALREAVQRFHGQEYLPEQPRAYSRKAKNAQEAHEAIRPTDPSTSPQAIGSLEFDPGAVQLYHLIRARALASQMSSARVKTVSSEFVDDNNSVVLRSTSSYVTFPGYLAATHGSEDGTTQQLSNIGDDDAFLSDADESGTGNNLQSSSASRQRAAAALSTLREGDSVQVEDPRSVDHETRPPGRFTEGTLVKELEKLGIGRPSTYAPTMKLLQARRYVRKEGRSLHAEPLGRVLTAFLCAYCPKYIDYGFTSRLEEELDDVSSGELPWRDLLQDFWGPFQENVSGLGQLSGTEVIDMLNIELDTMLFGGHSGSNDNAATASIPIDAEDTAQQRSTKACPACGNPLSLKLSHKGGPFVGCTSYPECSYTRPPLAIQDVLLDEDSPNSSRSEYNCKGMALAEKFGMRGSVRLLGNDPATGKEIFVRTGRFGPYIQLAVDSDHDMRRAPLPKDVNLRVVTLEYGLSLLALPRSLGPHPETEINIQVKNGKFGPYLVHGTAMRSIPKDINPLNITIEHALELLSQAKHKGKQRKGKEVISLDVSTKKGRKKKEKTMDNDMEGGSTDEDDGMSLESGRKSRSLGSKKVTRSRSAYIFFLMDRLEQKKAEREERKNKEGDGQGGNKNHIQEIAREWKLLSKEEKKGYELKAEEDKERSRMEREKLPNNNVDQGTSQERNGGSSKRRLSAYNIFIREYSAKARQEGTVGRGASGIMKQGATMWGTMTAEEKEAYGRKGA